MTFQSLKDERLEQAKNKIYSEMLIIITYFIALSFLYKSLYCHMTLSQCLTEFIILLFLPLYQAVRSRQMGVVLESTAVGWKKHLPVILVVFFMGALIWFANSSSSFENRSAATGIFVLFYLVLFVALRQLFAHMERKRAAKLEHRYDDAD